MKVRIQVIKVYDIDVPARDEEEAIDLAYSMQTVEIEEYGRLIDAATDHAITHVSMELEDGISRECVKEFRRAYPGTHR